MIKCIVIDDEPHAVELIVDYVQKSKDLELLAAFTDPIEAFHFINQTPLDLLFLDIQMPEMTGMQFLRLIPQRCDTILTTAYEQYAFDSYELDVVDYLLKPISFERFLLSVEKYKKRFTAYSHHFTASLSKASYIFIKSGFRTIKINLSEILFLKADSDYIEVHTKEKSILTLDSLKTFEEKLPQEEFIRVHRSYIISLSKIDFIERNRIVINQQYIPISKTYQAEFWKRIQSE